MSENTNPSVTRDRGVAAAFVELREATNASVPPPATPDWLVGVPMDPFGVSLSPLPTIPGFPMHHFGMYSEWSGPTGGGRSETIQAGLYEAALSGIPTLYLGHEITQDEFRVRTRKLAQMRGDEITDELRESLSAARYVDLGPVMAQAWAQPQEWVAAIIAHYRLVVIDPLSAAASALDLDFERSNTDYEKFYDALIQPLTKQGVAVMALDNTGHEAKSRSKGASAKRNRADLAFSATTLKEPLGLRIKCEKVRGARVAFKVGDTWTRYDGHAGFETTPREFRPTYLMEQISRAVESEPGINAGDLYARTTGRKPYQVQARDLLVTEQYVEMREDAGAKQHFSLRPYREADDPALAQRVALPEPPL